MMISVVVPLYNKEKSISHTIDSVLQQSYSCYELLIINDGSTDESFSRLNEYQDSRIKILNKSNGGVSSARNMGIEKSQYEYIAFLDGDDIWQNNHLQNLVNMIHDFDSEKVGGFAASFIKLENPNLFKTDDKDKAFLVKNYFQFMVEKKDSFNSSTLMVKKSKLLDTGLFKEGLIYGEDVEFWYRLFSKFQLVYSENVSVIYNIGAENRSDNHVAPLEKRFWQYDYRNADRYKKRYLDKLVAILLIDYINKKQYLIVKVVLKRYYRRLPGVVKYFCQLISNKIFS